MPGFRGVGKALEGCDDDDALRLFVVVNLTATCASTVNESPRKIRSPSIIGSHANPIHGAPHTP